MTLTTTCARWMQIVIACVALALLSACSTTDKAPPPTLENSSTWAVLPFANHTETPLAGQRAEAISEAVLHASGVSKVKRYPGSIDQDALFESGDRKRFEQAMVWAKSQGVRYVLTGSVDEWRYKVGVDGEPAAGVTLRIVDVTTGDTLWSAAGGKSGWSREALAAVAQKLIRDLLRAGLTDIR